MGEDGQCGQPSMFANFHLFSEAPTLPQRLGNQGPIFLDDHISEELFLGH